LYRTALHTLYWLISIGACISTPVQPACEGDHAAGYHG
jgi:hypothetical protein